MAPVLQLYGLSPEDERRLTQEQIDSLYQSAYQAYVETVGGAALRGVDSHATFANQISTSASGLRDTLRPRLDAALHSVLGARLRS